jgi:hypothetical protein
MIETQSTSGELLRKFTEITAGKEAGKRLFCGDDFVR